MLNKNSIGIIGSNGFIGQVLKRYYPHAKGYDIKGDCDPLEDVLRQDIIFIAFLTKDNSGMAIEDYAHKAPDGRVFIIKSTFQIGTCDLMQRNFPQHKFVYNCEFLTEATAWKDFTEPQFQILGCTHQSLSIVNDLFSILPDAPIKRVISPVDAEVLKHAQNSYYGLKVIFFNQLFDACQNLNSDYETIREILVKNPWVGDSHSVIWHHGYRGFGNPEISKCIAKDLISFCRVAKIPLLDKVKEINNEYLKMQNLSEVD